MPFPEGMTRETLSPGSGIAGTLAGFDTFDAFVEVQSGLAFLLVGDDAIEKLGFRRSNRGVESGRRMRGGAGSERQNKQRDGTKARFSMM